MSLYKYVPHPHVARRKKHGPVKVADQLPTKHRNPIIRFNARFAVICTVAVGSMWCAYLFAALALSALPTALKPGNIGFAFWLSSDFFQLTLLSVIIVGQNVQAGAADKRAQQTYDDAEAVLAEALKIQEHLAAQDAILTHLVSDAGREPARGPHLVDSTDEHDAQEDAQLGGGSGSDAG